MATSQQQHRDWQDDGLDANNGGPSATSHLWSSTYAIQQPHSAAPDALSLPVELSLPGNDEADKRIKRGPEPQVSDDLLVSVGENKQQQQFSEMGLTDAMPSHPLAISRPYFEAKWPTNVSVVLGQPVSLKCRTRLLGDRMVNTTANNSSHMRNSVLIYCIG